MTNLSDLLPAGAASKQLNFTADGAIASGQTVALQTAGTVKAIAADAVSSALGTAATYASAIDDNAIAYDSTNNKILVAYKDSSNNKGMAVVGTISGTSISFGTAVEFSGNVSGDQFRRIAVCFNSTEGKFVIVYRDSTINNYGRARTATISGTSVSFGTSATFNTATTFSPTCAFDSTSNRVVIAYPYQSDGDGHAVVAKITGTDLSFGSEVEFETGYTHFPVAVYDSNADRTVIVYRDAGNSNYGTAIVATVSDMSISFGSAVVFESAQTEHQSAAYDSANYKIVIGYSDQGNSGYGTGIVGTVSGTSISFGSAAVFESASTGSVQMQAAYNVAAGKTVIGYGDSGNSTYGTYVEATVSGTSLTFSTPAVFEAATVGRTPAVAAYDSTNKLVVFSYQDEGNSNAGTAIAYRSQSSNLSDFLGIADAAISNAASGKITMKGGVVTNSNLVPDVPAISVGTAGDTSDKGQHMAAAYDANAQRVVTFYKDTDNSGYGTSAVGTVSGTSITFGTPVVFNSASTSDCTAAYNSTAQKVMVAFNSAGSTGRAIYGAVSGTTIDFSSYTVTQFDSNNISEMQVVFDTNAEKMVIAYKLPGSESQLGKAVVGTLSGTTLSFGTAVTFNNAATEKVSAAYDSTNNKVVILYQDSGNSNYPTAIVGTVSGTSISFGSETALSSSAASWNTVSYDSGNQKIVAAYRDDVVEDLKVAVGTVSGTSISFATPVSFSVLVQWLSSAYDPDNGIVLFNFKNQSGNAGTCVPAIIDGTSFSFGSSVVFETGSTEYTSTVYDTNADKFVVAFNDGGGGDAGRAVVQTSSKTVGVTPNQIYYVQDDGSLSTTSSSVTAGKAMSTNSINLDYST